MAEDWLVAALRSVEGTATEAAARLSVVDGVLAPLRADREAGVPLPVIAQRLVDGGGEARRAAAAAFLKYEQAVSVLRAQVVCALVDEEGATLSALARRMGLSRQAVTRLYEAGKASQESRPDRGEGP